MVLSNTETEQAPVSEVMLAMADGVRLYTRYAVPKGAEKCPTVFIRTPYEASRKSDKPGAADYTKQISRYLDHGYAVVLQHCRGKGDSEGYCIPYTAEREDGLATLAFIRTLPFYNGEIFITGESYTATVHLAYMTAKPQDIKGAYLGIQSDRMFSRNYRNGLNYRLNNIAWWSSMVTRQYPNANLGEALKYPYIDAARRVFGADIPEFTEALLHNTCDDFWQNDEKWYAAEAMTMPTLLVEGWFDMYVEGMVSMWQRLPEATRQRSAMLIGPYGHSTSLSAKSEYPLENGGLPADFAVEWFDSIRENRPYRYAECGKINYYSIGAGEWRAATYPAAEGATRRFYFGKDTLTDVQGKGAALTYRYDPEHTTNAFKFFNIYRAHAAGSIDSILSFVSEPVTEAQAFLGEVCFHLAVSSDCEDTAFFARLYFVEDGVAYNLSEAMGALRHLTGDYTPGKIAVIEIKSPAIAFTLRPGMQVRVDIASESGNYLPHPNVCGHFAKVSKARVAHNTIYTDGCYVDLPLEG